MRKRPMRKVRSKRKYRRYRTPKTEKKLFKVAAPNGGYACGQVYCDATAQISGHHVLEITPQPVKGTGSNNRIGDVINLSGVTLKYQFQQQTNGSTKLKGKIYIIRVKPGFSTAANNLAGAFLEPNYFVQNVNAGMIGPYDYRSDRNQTYYNNYEVLGYKKFNIPADQLTGMTNFADAQITFKKNHTIRFDPLSGLVSSGQLFQLIVMDTGNSGPNASTLANIGLVSASTGCFVRYLHYFYYTDA